MKVLVTGASGFSGGEIVAGLLNLGFEVTALVTRSSFRISELKLRHPNLRVHIGRINDSLEINDKLDVVVHVAARSAWPGVTVDSMILDNILATRFLISQAKIWQIKKFIFFSSLSVHGVISTKVVDALTPIVTPHTYGLTKLLCEQMLAAESKSFQTLAFRLPGILGPGSVRNWLSTSLANAKKGKDIFVFDPNALFNNAVHVDDLSIFISSTLKQEWSNNFDVFPLGADGEMLTGDVAALLAKAGGKNSSVKISADPKMSYSISSKYAKKTYGYCPMPVEELILKFIKENSN